MWELAYTTTGSIEDTVANLLLGRVVGLVDAVGWVGVDILEIGINCICLP
jgi:hypothetical protein